MVRKGSRRSEEELDFDKVLGENIRRFRLLIHWSQEELAAQLGLTFQQIQKYESGFNRVSCSKLYQLCEVLECGYQDLLPETIEPNIENEQLKVATELYLFFEKKGINPITFMKFFEEKLYAECNGTLDCIY